MRTTIWDKIGKLKKLLDKGAITEREYDQEKTRLLSGKYPPGSKVEL